MSLRKEVNRKAITVKDITGDRIKTIPAGTEFIVTWLGDEDTSMCKGLDITMIWNSEFKLLPNDK